jgi:hypothetical protein
MIVALDTFLVCHFCKKQIQPDDLVAETGNAHSGCHDEAFLARFRNNLKEDSVRQETEGSTLPLLSSSTI